MGRAAPWLTVYCCDYLCGHSRAVALSPTIRWGVDDPVELIRERFFCVMCGRKGARFILSTPDHDTQLHPPFPVERPVGVGGRRNVGESWNDVEERNAAVYQSKREVWSTNAGCNSTSRWPA